MDRREFLENLGSTGELSEKIDNYIETIRSKEVSRRSFLKGSALVTGAAALSATGANILNRDILPEAKAQETQEEGMVDKIQIKGNSSEPLNYYFRTTGPVRKEKFELSAQATGSSEPATSESQSTSSTSDTTSSIEGSVTAIEPDQHPNLYFNQNEIDALRQKVVQKREPQKAADAYFNHVQGTSPASKPSNMDELDWAENYREGSRAARKNMKACFSYMLEPSESKAEELRSALLSWAENEEVAAWTRDGQNSGWVQISLAFMYDLLYNSGVLSDSDKEQLDSWFAWSAEQMIEPNEWWSGLPSNEDKTHTIDKEGSRRQEYDNWWTIKVSCGMVCAMVSHDQSLVDLGFNSNVPSDYYLSDISEYSPDTRDLHNLIKGSVYPSGYNYDGYKRNYGFDAPDESYDEAGEPQAGNGQHYHFYSMYPLIFAAEAAMHNGANAFGYGDNALLRTFKKGSTWADNAHRNNGSNDNWRQAYWYIYRRHPGDGDISSVTDQAASDYDWFRIGDKTAPIWGALGDIDG